MEEQDEQPFDPADILMRSVANVICGIIFGEGSDTTSPDLNRLLQLNADSAANASDLQLVTMLDFIPGAHYLPIKAYDRVIQPIFQIHDIIRKILTQRQSNFDPAQPTQDLISGLLHAKYEAQCESDDEKAVLLSNDYIISTIEDVFFGGYETKSTTLKWAIAYLAKCPKFQGDIQCQLDKVVGERSPSLDDRSNLPLIEATIMETLRLANVLPFAVPHVSMADTTLCGYRVPKDTIVFADIESVHLDPECWKDPTEFNPYRHINEAGKLIINQGNFFPFGAGRRVCAGEKLAKVELFLFTSWMLHKFTFIAEDGHAPKVKGAFIQFPSAYKIRAIKRR